MEATTSMKQFLTTVTATGTKADAEASMIVSTMSADREGDRVFPGGMDAAAYLKNPILMWSHGGSEKYAALPIGTVTALETNSTGIAAAWRWLKGDPLADRVSNAWNQGIVRAASIGFKPIERTPNQHGGFDVTKFSLLEISLCAVPMNAEAVRALKSLGLYPADRPALVREPSPPLDVVGDRAAWRVPRLRLADNDVVVRVVDSYRVDSAALHDTVQRVLIEGVGAAVDAAIRQSLDAGRGRVQ